MYLNLFILSSCSSPLWLISFLHFISLPSIYTNTNTTPPHHTHTHTMTVGVFFPGCNSLLSNRKWDSYEELIAWQTACTLFRLKLFPLNIFLFPSLSVYDVTDSTLFHIQCTPICLCTLNDCWNRAERNHLCCCHKWRNCLSYGFSLMFSGPQNTYNVSYSAVLWAVHIYI